MGTLPLDIRKFAVALGRGAKATDYIEMVLRKAEDDLIRFAHQRILKELKSSPDGVRTAVFRGIKHEGVSLVEPRQVAVAMKERQAIVYHDPSGEYRMVSRAHRTALLERYDPVE